MTERPPRRCTLAPWVLNAVENALLADKSGENRMIEVVDYATGTAGSYCIRRMDGIYASYWNPFGWAGSGYVFTDKKLADAVQALLAPKERYDK